MKCERLINKKDGCALLTDLSEVCLKHGIILVGAYVRMEGGNPHGIIIDHQEETPPGNAVVMFEDAAVFMIKAAAAIEDLPR